MTDSKPDIDPNLCPLCNKDNRCASQLSQAQALDCWCQSPQIEFTQAMLSQVPQDAKNKACICQACAISLSQLTSL
ncbi:hypothetical protein DBZ36_07730 [Alginatibacterium sediminis]|uniref:Cysteine-rich CWC family protein n=1 Tax=Alginatibacterium sediminis TaxID=2164068 RepID=A0A420EHV0_9ALTE|nr:cysteine-rich CWC family protein [Alginatibacterium sediminis]RKF20321.1 hypothetical protein DBZ36_07730 [Alginatibacterium sediminis]